MPDIDDVDELRERLERVARETWGEQWTIEARYFADGDVRMHAFSTHGTTDADEQIREQLMPDAEGQLHHERLVLDDEGSVKRRDVLESPVEIDE